MAGNMNDLHAFRFNLDGTAGPFNFTCTRGWHVLDVIGLTQLGAGGGGETAALNRATAAAPTVFNNVSVTALAIDTADDIEYVDGLVTAQLTFSTGDIMQVAVANTPTAEVIAEVLPTTWIPG
jgi:hypothetical protein